GVIPVAGDARHVLDDRGAAAGDAVEERRLPDVRAADERDDGARGKDGGGHRPSLLSVASRSLQRSSTLTVSWRKTLQPRSFSRLCRARVPMVLSIAPPFPITI